MVDRVAQAGYQWVVVGGSGWQWVVTIGTTLESGQPIRTAARRIQMTTVIGDMKQQSPCMTQRVQDGFSAIGWIQQTHQHRTQYRPLLCSMPAPGLACSRPRVPILKITLQAHTSKAKQDLPSWANSRPEKGGMGIAN